MSSTKKKAKFRNISSKGKTFDGYEEDVAGLFSVENVEKFAKDTGRSIYNAYKYLKEKAGFNEGGMPRKRIGSIDYRKGGMVMRTTDNRKNKI